MSAVAVAALVVAIVAQIIAVGIAALKVSASYGRTDATLSALEQKSDEHATMLERHRVESREANEALRDDLSEIKRSASETRERVVALETAHKLRAVK